MNFMIVEPNVEHAESIVKVNIDSWRSTYKELIDKDVLDKLDSNFQERVIRTKESIKGNKNDYFVAIVNNEVVGFVVYGNNRETVFSEATGEVYAIYVLDQYHGYGIGEELLNRAFNKLEDNHNSIIIWCLKDNPSRGFYEKMGGVLSSTKTITIGEKVLDEVGYLFNL